MTSVGIFGDLPPIAFNDDGPLNTNWSWSGYADREPHWSAHPGSYRAGTPMFASGFPPNMERFLGENERTLFTADVLHLETSGSDRSARRFFSPQHEPQAPWPLEETYPRQVSPDSSQSASSCNSYNHFQGDEMYSANFGHRRSSDGASDYGPQEAHYTKYSPYASYTPDVTTGGGSCNMREIQPYPSPIEDADQGATEYDDCTVDVKMSSEPNTGYYHGTKSEAEQDHDSYNSAHPDDDTMRAREAESVQPCIKDDDDADADYKPYSAPVKRSRRRSSASSSSTRSIVKRHASSRKASASSHTQTHRVAKRQNTAKSHSTTTSPTSCSPNSSISSANAPRPFPCPLAAYSCTSTFASKNEWKRHVSTQHIRLGFWRCDLCPTLHVGSDDDNNNTTTTTTTTTTTSPSTATHTAPSYNDFNRKDLFAQHLRRMHLAPTKPTKPVHAPSTTTTTNTTKRPSTHTHPSPATTATLAEPDLPAALERCYIPVRSAPPRSACLFCARAFAGPGSWAERMEHVGRHLEKMRRGEGEVGVVEKWREDEGLRDWLVGEGLVVGDGRGGWVLGVGAGVGAGVGVRRGEGEVEG